MLPTDSPSFVICYDWKSPMHKLRFRTQRKEVIDGPRSRFTWTFHSDDCLLWILPNISDYSHFLNTTRPLTNVASPTYPHIPKWMNISTWLESAESRTWSIHFPVYKPNHRIMGLDASNASPRKIIVLGVCQIHSKGQTFFPMEESHSALYFALYSLE